MRTRVSCAGCVSFTNPPSRKIRKCLLIAEGENTERARQLTGAPRLLSQQLDRATPSWIGQGGERVVEALRSSDHGQFLAMIG